MPTIERVSTTRQRRIGLGGLLVGVILLAAAVFAAVHQGSTHTQPVKKPIGAGRGQVSTDTPFARNSIWNARLPASAPIASDSAALVTELKRQVAQYGTWINIYSYSSPIYTVPASQRRVPVTLDVSSDSASVARLAHVLRAGVPIPPNARPAPGTDGDLVVWQPSTDTMWELWIARLVGSTWHARWGGEMRHVSRNPGFFTNPPDWGTAATSLALLGGTIRFSDLRAGHIDHALGISIPEARQGVVAWPAQRSDGKLNSPDAIPEGTRFRLDPHLNLNRLNLPPLTRMIARAAQRYGLFVRDQSGVVAFYGQQPTGTGANPYALPFHGLNAKTLTEAFPWSHLEVVRAPVHSYR